MGFPYSGQEFLWAPKSAFSLILVVHICKFGHTLGPVSFGGPMSKVCDKESEIKVAGTSKANLLFEETEVQRSRGLSKDMEQVGGS